jgi:hypothetical protein
MPSCSYRFLGFLGAGDRTGAFVWCPGHGGCGHSGYHASPRAGSNLDGASACARLWIGHLRTGRAPRISTLARWSRRVHACPPGTRNVRHFAPCADRKLVGAALSNKAHFILDPHSINGLERPSTKSDAGIEEALCRIVAIRCDRLR